MLPPPNTEASMINGTDFSQLALKLLDYAHQGNWRMLVAIALSGVIWFVRTYLLGAKVQGWKYVGVVARWCHTDRGGVVLTLVVGVAGGLVTALSAKTPLGLDLIVTGVVNGVLASGFFVGLKKLLTNADKPGTSLVASGNAAAKGGAALLLLLGLSLIHGCYCFRPENAN